MSRIEITREPPQVVDVSKIRRPMGIARKRRIHAAYGGLCALCGAEVPLTGVGVIYDHEPPIFITLRDVDEDVRPLCPACDRPKTNGDQTKRGKVNRIIDREVNGPKPAKLQGRSQLQSRPFPNDLRKKLSGRVERVETAKPAEERTVRHNGMNNKSRPFPGGRREG